MIHPHTRLGFVSEVVGNGMFATRDIPKGTLVYVQDPMDVRITDQEFKKLREPLKTQVDIYSFIDGEGDRILCWDLGKYVNHSCTPNSLSTGWGFEVALRDIPAGEEITDDYGMFNISKPMPIACTCARCEGVVRADDLDRHAAAWDAVVQPVLPWITRVEQPLWPLLKSSARQSVLNYLNGTGKYRSVAGLRDRRANGKAAPRRVATARA